MDASALIASLLHEPRKRYNSSTVLGLIHECDMGVTDDIELSRMFTYRSYSPLTSYRTRPRNETKNFSHTIVLANIDQGWNKVVDARDVVLACDLATPMPLRVNNPRPRPEDDICF